MILLIHILLAITSTAYIIYSLIFPSKYSLKILQLSSLATIGSGVAMTIVNPLFLPRMCVSGIIYLALIITVILSSQKRFETNK